MNTKENVKREIREVELEFKKLFSIDREFNEHLHRWQDEMLYDMYDHNQFIPIQDTVVADQVASTGYESNSSERATHSLTDRDFEQAVEFQKKHNWHFLKFDARERLDQQLEEELATKIELEGGETYTMYLSEKHIENWKRNANVVVLDVQTDDIVDAIEEIELKNYAHIYGGDFTKRKVARYTAKAKECIGLHYYGAFVAGKIAGACYAFEKNGYVQIDSLIVNEEMRKQYVATTLLAHIAEHLEGTLFLHADPDDTPKDMYAKMGFEIVDTVWEYCATWN